MLIPTQQKNYVQVGEQLANHGVSKYLNQLHRVEDRYLLLLRDELRI